MSKATIQSDRVKNLETDHHDCRYGAPSFSSGLLRLLFETSDKTNPRNWMIEFRCTTCGEPFFAYLAKYHDRIREALIENGIIPSSDKVGPNY